MPCSTSISETSCTWCATDQLIADCRPLSADVPPLPQIVQEYCRARGIVTSYALYEHLGGECRRCYSMVLGMCREALRACPHPPREWTPEDVSQTLFSRILQSAWEPEKAPLGGWLGVIVRRIVTDAVKAAYGRHTKTAGDWAGDEGSRAPHALAGAGNGDPADLAEARDLRRRLGEAIDALPFEARQLVTLRFGKGCPLRVISQRLQIPLATAARRLQKALRDLAKMLGRGEDDILPQLGGEP
jgi:RNA polymerase sigma factor (sigma-70 family)